MSYLKFRTKEDQIKFLVEGNRVDLIHLPQEEIPEQVFEDFIKKRKISVLGLKDFRKSQATKQAWRKNKWSFLSGMHKFHRSIAGKRLHRSMGRFLSTRLFEPTKLKFLTQMQGEALTGISSIRTHFYIESQYYMTLNEEADFKLLLEHVMPILVTIEEKIYQSKPESITDAELELLIRMIEKKEIYKPTALIKGDSFVDEWKKIDAGKDSSLKNMNFVNSKNSGV